MGHPRLHTGANGVKEKARSDPGFSSYESGLVVFLQGGDVLFEGFAVFAFGEQFALEFLIWLCRRRSSRRNLPASVTRLAWAAEERVRAGAAAPESAPTRDLGTGNGDRRRHHRRSQRSRDGGGNRGCGGAIPRRNRDGAADARCGGLTGAGRHGAAEDTAQYRGGIRPAPAPARFPAALAGDGAHARSDPEAGRACGSIHWHGRRRRVRPLPCSPRPTSGSPGFARSADAA